MANRYTGPIPLQDRFWLHVNKDGPVPAHVPELGPCWLWTGAVSPSGYGMVGVENGRARRAHRASWELANGPIPEGMHVRHRCDVRNCVRPSHLTLGTPLQNMGDAVERGRIAAGERSPKRLHPDTSGFQGGERHWNARLSDEQVADIRRRHAAGEGQRVLASEFAVSQGMVSLLVRGLRRP